MIHAPKPWRWKGYQMQRYQWSFVACPRIASWRWLALTLSEAFLCKCCPEAKCLWNGNLREEWALLSLIFAKMGRAFQLHSCASSLSGWDGLKFKRVVLPPPASMPELARGRPPQSERTFTPNLHADWHSKHCLYEEQTISSQGIHLLPLALGTATWSSHLHLAPQGPCRLHERCHRLLLYWMMLQLWLRAGPWELIDSVWKQKISFYS